MSDTLKKLFSFSVLLSLMLIVAYFIAFHKATVLPPHLVYSSANFECAGLRTPNVTRLIHQSWKTRHLLPIFKNMSATWKSCYPSWKYVLWTDADNRNLVEKHFPWFLQRYNLLPKNIMRADAARYMYMYLYGGIYADLDTECVRPFEPLLNSNPVVLGAMEGEALLPEGLTQNSFFYSSPRHPLWLYVLKYIFNHDNSGQAEVITGPNAMMQVVHDYRKVCKDPIKVYEPRYFNPFSWVKGVPSCATRFKMTTAEFAKCRKKFKNSYVIQYHAHTWS